MLAFEFWYYKYRHKGRVNAQVIQVKSFDQTPGREENETQFSTHAPSTSAVLHRSQSVEQDGRRRTSSQVFQHYDGKTLYNNESSYNKEENYENRYEKYDPGAIQSFINQH